MLHFDSTTDALLVLSWLSIDHRCSLTNCGKVICLRNRNYRHDLYSPPPNRPTLYHCPAQRDFAQIFRHQQFCTTTRIPGRDLQKEHLTGRGGGITQANPQNSCHPSGLIWKCHRPARIHKHPLQGYLHSYKKTVYFFLNFL